MTTCLVCQNQVTTGIGSKAAKKAKLRMNQNTPPAPGKYKALQNRDLHDTVTVSQVVMYLKVKLSTMRYMYVYIHSYVATLI